MTTETRLLPMRSRPDYETTPVIIPIRRSGAVFDALASQTARMILTILTEEPMTVSDIAETAGTSLQNAMYHTNNLQDAGVIEGVDTWYSEKGRKMKVYAACYERIVLTLNIGQERGSPTHHGSQT